MIRVDISESFGEAEIAHFGHVVTIVEEEVDDGI